MALGERHDRGVGEAKAEIGVAGIDFDGSTKQRHRGECDAMLAGADRRKEQSGGVAAEARAQQLVDLDHDGAGDDQVASEEGDQLAGQRMCTVASVRRRQQRAGVGNDLQRTVTGSRR
jgi:hypothetical protein